MRRVLAVTSAIVVLSVGVGTQAASASAAAGQDPAAKRREVQRQKAKAAAQVDVLRATDADLESALKAMDNDVRGQEARAAGARQRAAVAAAELAKAKQAEAATNARLADLRSSMKAAAVDAYVQGPSRQLALAVDAKSLSELATKQYFIDVAANQSAATADELRATREDLGVERESAQAAQQRAADRRKAMDAELRQLKVAQAAKERVAASVEARLEQSLAEVASLEAVDQKLAGEIAARQRRIAAALATRATAAPARSSRSSAGRIGAVTLATVRGITVAASIADNLEGLMAAAEADGITLGGGGYRSSDGQVAARRANCGSSDYDIYEKPASACSPPTARPGQSMHEQGLAIDFTANGHLIQSRSDPGFVWLSRNAGRFGFANLPREPWHWSTNGN